MVEDLKIEAVGYSETLLRLCQTTRCSKVDRIVRVLTVMPLVCLMWEIFGELNCKYQTDFTACHFAEYQLTPEHTSNFVAAHSALYRDIRI
jgi:hypothetical protein